MAFAADYERRTSRSIKGGVVAGIVGGVVIAALLLALALAEGRDPWMVLKGAGAPFLGARAMQPGLDVAAVAVGALCHFAVSIVWGVLFGLVFFGLSKAATLVAGVFWGVVVWLGMYYVVLPLVGLSEVTRTTPIVTAVVTHLAFGLGVALGFLPFQLPRRPLAGPSVPSTLP
jgi:hypothetical protein